ARRFSYDRVRRVQHHRSRRIRSLSRAARGRSARARELRVCAARALHREGGPHLPAAVLEMIAVIFEVAPHAARRDDYFRIAAELRPLLDEIDGFISIERFQSLSDPER